MHNRLVGSNVASTVFGIVAGMQIGFVGFTGGTICWNLFKMVLYR